MIAIEWKVHVKLKLSETQEVKNCDNYYVLIDLTLFYNSSYKLWLISELLFIKKRRFYLLNYSNCCANKTKNLKGNFYFFRRIVSNIKLLLVIFLLLPITPPPPLHLSSFFPYFFRYKMYFKCQVKAACYFSFKALQWNPLLWRGLISNWANYVCLDCGVTFNQLECKSQGPIRPTYLT